MKALNEDSNFLSTVGLLIDNICFDASFFNQLHYSHVKKECNKVAHSLSWYVLWISNFVVWMEDVSLPLFSIVQADIVGFY